MPIGCMTARPEVPKQSKLCHYHLRLYIFQCKNDYVYFRYNNKYWKDTFGKFRLHPTLDDEVQHRGQKTGYRPESGGGKISLRSCELRDEQWPPGREWLRYICSCEYRLCCEYKFSIAAKTIVN